MILPTSTPVTLLSNMHPASLSLSIPPELFPIIASFVPLRSAPHTLRSLALVNRRLYDIVRPLLYSRLILRTEDDTIAVIQKILREPRLGLAVTELYIMSELSVETRKGQKPFDVLVGLQMLVKKRLLPRLFALGIYLLNGWHYDENYKPVMLHGRLLADFWSDLRIECPRLRSLGLRNIGHGSYDPWLSGPVIDSINCILNLTDLRLEWSGAAAGLSKKDDLKILMNLPRLASSIHRLSLETDYQDAKHILSLDFPNLKYLRLQSFASNHKTSKVMDFFRRHPQLESLALLDCIDNWFPDEIEVGFLPNLKHLKARFDDIRNLVPILPQLISLGFGRSYNGQVPYLLRAVLPNGLPRLKSLEIEQQITGWENRRLEGVLWYETQDGKFCIEKIQKNVPRNFMNGYIHSVVRGAPNLEELGLHGMTLFSESLQILGPTLSQLRKLERFYYRGFSLNPRYGNAPPQNAHDTMLSGFLSSAEALAQVCTSLTTVTSISGRYLPYISAEVERDSAGAVTGVRRKDGVGMLISAHEDDPFPCNT